eukprot:11177331-Lingulodinium_polyedra.AAC.1
MAGPTFRERRARPRRVCASAACRTAKTAGPAPRVGATATKRCAVSARMTVDLPRACPRNGNCLMLGARPAAPAPP